MKIKISNLIRQLRLIFLMDKIRFYFQYLIKIRERHNFNKENPQILLPPSYLIYESFGLQYYKYYFDGKDTARWLLEHLKRHIDLKNLNILDWGCGPSRVIRHLPELLNNSCTVYGSDYNIKSIAWNRKFLNGINYNLNFIDPPLSYVDNSFDLTYGLSIFTHLSEEFHFKWFNEIVRVTRKHGIIFLSLHGEVFKTKLTYRERELFDNGQLVVKGKTKIGHRTYAAFHPEAFVKKMIDKHLLLEHIHGVIKNGRPQQDVWIIKVIK